MIDLYYLEITILYVVDQRLCSGDAWESRILTRLLHQLSVQLISEWTPKGLMMDDDVQELICVLVVTNLGEEGSKSSVFPIFVRMTVKMVSAGLIIFRSWENFPHKYLKFLSCPPQAPAIHGCGFCSFVQPMFSLLSSVNNQLPSNLRRILCSITIFCSNSHSLQYPHLIHRTHMDLLLSSITSSACLFL